MVRITEITEPVNVDQIKALLAKHFFISGEIAIDDQGLVSIDGSCRLQTLCDVLPVKFKCVTGSFFCSAKTLTSLAGCPTSVGENFGCADNKLTSVVGCPANVGWNFNCSNNQLTSLEGCPTEAGHFDCERNNLTSLAGCPSKIAGGFDCSRNRLTSLSGCPSRIPGDFNCSHNLLTSLLGGPAEVSVDFYCDRNDLKSLDGMAKTVGGIVEITLNPNLPVLRLVGHNVVDTNHDNVVADIINKYHRKASRANIVACQNELIAAGFAGNAKW